MNDPRTCKHSNLRKTVCLIVSLPANSNKLDKKAIRSKDVQIDVANWDALSNYTYCADCGKVIVPKETLYGKINCITQRTSNPTGKINRIKALREITDCGLRAAKYFVDSLYHDYGSGAQLTYLQDMTVRDAKHIIQTYAPEMYFKVLGNWSA